jgi:gluconolactonase
VPLQPISTATCEKLGLGVERPEGVVVSADDRVFCSDRRAAVAEMMGLGAFRRMGPKGGAPNGLAMDRQGRILIANFGIANHEPGSIQRFDPKTGRHETLITEVGGHLLTAPSCVAIDEAGNIWGANSTHAESWPNALDGRADGFVFMVTPHGEARIMADGLKFPNGLAFGASDRFLYVSQTSEGDILRFVVTPGPTLSNRERLGQVLGRIPGLYENPASGQHLGYVYGLGVDAEDNVWACLPAANKIVALSMTGRLVELWHDPSGRLLNQPTSIAWGGAGLRDLYIGSMRADYIVKARSPVRGLPLYHQREPERVRGFQA